MIGRRTGTFVAKGRLLMPEEANAMTLARWWMRVVGLFYVLVFVVVVFVKAPIQVEGPPGVLELARSGDRVAAFVVDTWVTLGLFVLAVGIGLLAASRIPRQSVGLVWAVACFEASGIVADVYKITRGYDVKAPVTWMVIHGVIIATGLLTLRNRSPEGV
jgi:hypothetical protein